MKRVYIALGSNIGEPIKNIKNAIALLNDGGVKLIKSSSFYHTEPYGVKDQPDFVNSVIIAETTLSLKELFNLIKKIEKNMGRKKNIKYGPRVIDIDIIFYENLIYEDANIIIPHPKMVERSFVLYPLEEIDPLFLHPLLKETISQLKNNLKDDLKIKKINDEKAN